MPGLFELVDGIGKVGYNLAIASSAPRKKIDIVLEKLGLGDKYEQIVSGEDEVKLGKPFPDIFLKAAEKLKMPASNIVVLEDAQNGVEAAKAAGMYCIGVHNKFTYEKLGIRQDLSKADIQVESLKDITVDLVNSI
jgi:beta-phosphoglucomutase-like phosphatase (HAD superfamily)